MAKHLSGVLDDLEQCADGDDVSLGDVLAAFKDSSVGALIVVFGLIAAIPVIGGIPGVSILTGTMIIAVVVQSLFTKGGLWAPRVLRERSIEASKVKNGIEAVRPYAKRVDKVLKPRLSFLVEGSAQRFMMLSTAIFLAVSFYPLALVPWGVQVPSIAVVMLGLAMIGKDGLFSLFGLVLAAISIGLLIHFGF